MGEVLRQLLQAAAAADWQVETREAAPGRPLTFLRRPAAVDPGRHVYLSAGIHGDEPAGPLALLELIRADVLPRDIHLWLCPCLNPTGARQSTRHNEDGLDLNRDYNHLRSPEVRSHTGWLREVPSIDLALLLHEDWESDGFYLYELNPAGSPSLAQAIVDAVEVVCPIERAAVVDGRPTAAPGIIRPPDDPRARPDWPEAFWLLQHHAPLSYTLEAPSDFPLATRVASLVTAVRAAVDAHQNPA